VTEAAADRAAPSREARLTRLGSNGVFREVVLCGLLAGLYYGSAKLGYFAAFSGPVAAIAWLPVGIGISFLYFGGLRLWPGVLLGDLLANDYTIPLGGALGQTIGNVVEVVVAAYLLRRLLPGRRPSSSVVGVCVMVGAIATGTAISATVGPTSLSLSNGLDDAGWLHVWRTWWLGDTAGALLVVPLALAWAEPRSRLRPQRVLEGVAVLATVVGLSAIALRSDRPLGYIVFPALTWAALRFGARGGTLAVAVTAGFALWGIEHHTGPFILQTSTASTLQTQLFLLVAAVTTALLAAVAGERRAFADRLVESRRRLVDVADRERRRLERDLHDGAQQRLLALTYKLRAASDAAAGLSSPLATALREAEDDLGTAIEELRELGHGIRPAVLADLGLANAIRSIAVRSPVHVVLGPMTPARFDATAESTAYYVVAEAIANAHRHAHATTIEVHTWNTASWLHVDVVDDGVGGASEASGRGLQGLRDRVEAIGGRFVVRSVRGVGTHVMASVPARVLA
jgi:signal transduction histidine kinase